MAFKPKVEHWDDIKALVEHRIAYFENIRNTTTDHGISEAYYALKSISEAMDGHEAGRPVDDGAD